MNKNNAKDYLPLVQALADGKTIQFRAFDSDPWKDASSIDSKTWTSSAYRIKPEPREFEIGFHDELSNKGDTACCISQPGQKLKQCDSRQTIRVREILDEP